MTTPETVKSYTREELNELGAEVGASLMELIGALRADAAEMLHKVADIQAAWSARDWQWLADAGVVGRKAAALMMLDDVEEAPTACCVCDAPRADYPFDDSAARYCGRCASDLGLTLAVVE